MPSLYLTCSIIVLNAHRRQHNVFLFYWTSYIHQSGTQNLVLFFFKETFWHLFVCFKCQCTPAWRQECICTTTPLWALIKSNSSSRCEDSDIWICAIKHILLWRHVQLRCDNEFADVKVEWILSNGDCPNVAFGGFVTQYWPPVNIWFQMVETIFWKGLLWPCTSGIRCLNP